MNAYIKLSTLEYPRHVGDIEIDFNKDYALVEWVDMPFFDALLQRCYEGKPILIDGVWCMTWIVRDATPKELRLIEKNKLDAIKNRFLSWG